MTGKVRDEARVKIIIGLGNPGTAYKATRHNAGFMAVEKLAGREGFAFKANRSFKSLVAAGKIRGASVCLALPRTFMNRSGDAVAAILRKKRLPPKDVLLVCDDVALPLGTLRMKAKGSDGGHNGLASVFEKVGTRDIPRLRLGVGGEKTPKALSDYVLSRFDKDEEAVFERVLARAVGAMQTWITEGIASAMNQFNIKQRSR